MCKKEWRTCSDTRGSYMSVYTTPFMVDYHHDILNYWYDKGNTRFLATMKQIGFDLPSLGKAYNHMKYAYFSEEEQFKFSIYMDALRFAVEQVRMNMIKNLAHSETLTLYQCDFEQSIMAFRDSLDVARVEAQRQHNIIFASRRDVEIRCQEIIDFANCFLICATENQDSLKRNTFGWDAWRQHKRTLPEVEQGDFDLLRSNRKESWRKWSIDIPARMVAEMRLAHAEQRMNGDWENCSEHGPNRYAAIHTKMREVESSLEDVR